MPEIVKRCLRAGMRKVLRLPVRGKTRLRGFTDAWLMPEGGKSFGYLHGRMKGRRLTIVDAHNLPVGLHGNLIWMPGTAGGA